MGPVSRAGLLLSVSDIGAPQRIRQGQLESPAIPAVMPVAIALASNACAIGDESNTNPAQFRENRLPGPL
jgi:hypothetical protein